ncbi:uncharacterized protein TRUGW13939_03951 [Talaromyces rugulosus]|uniref:Uncharacterized protein n=1 Tax=Talaromyces rugulosus TaxID=121627 RepID=A0A7H8QS78_TALRU|nr:uncharacterized protein TRUGW13939_03951 [Talaromyces rugulosus]QKX56844.1 hypothetical protein TRUGW13939_03951 [Talaromyces rugulosus]
MADPNASLSPLSRSDGSATYNCPATGVQILGSVTGPVELPGRRDAQRPEDATLEVLVKPGTAQSAVGERHAEGILRTLLSRVVLGREKGFPRRGVVITLVILGGSGGAKVGRGESYIPVLPALLHTALLSLLSAAVPMSMTFTSVALAVTNANEIIGSPSSNDCKTAKSLHALSFSSKGHLLLNESQGNFDFDTWELVYERAYSICSGAKGEDGDVSMDGKQNLESVIREVVEDKIHNEYSWAIDAV